MNKPFDISNIRQIDGFKVGKDVILVDEETAGKVAIEFEGSMVADAFPDEVSRGVVFIAKPVKGETHSVYVVQPIPGGRKGKDAFETGYRMGGACAFNYVLRFLDKKLAIVKYWWD